MFNKRGWIARLCALTVDATPAALLLGALGLAAVGFTSATRYSCPAPNALPLPSSKPVNDYETVLGRFLEHLALPPRAGPRTSTCATRAPIWSIWARGRSRRSGTR